MTIAEAEIKAKQQLQLLYEHQEANAITRVLFTHITGQNSTQRKIQGSVLLSSKQEAYLNSALERLGKMEPIQYILEEAWFYNYPFEVNKHVLIPRPETEELVDWIKRDAETQDKPTTIIDIGTGSGCIAIALKKSIANSRVYAMDICSKALDVARKNAERLNTDIHFVAKDILQENSEQTLPMAHIIVSNPPYVTYHEQKDMERNVLDYEPQKALFIPNDKPLLFYERIVAIAKQRLFSEGCLYFEINEQFGEAMVHLLEANGFYRIVLRKDLRGKHRMIKGILKNIN